MRLILIRADQVLRHGGENVATTEQTNSIDATGKSDEELGGVVDTPGDEILPVVVVEAETRGIAKRVVVELDPDLVESGLLQDILHLEVVPDLGALGSSGEDQARVVGRDEIAEMVNQADIRLLVI